MKLQETLERLNFSRLEAQIYMALIGSEPMSAYQLAKKIAIARPSIYNALEHMLDKGMVELVPDQTALYTAQEPEVLLGRMPLSWASLTSSFMVFSSPKPGSIFR